VADTARPYDPAQRSNSSVRRRLRLLGLGILCLLLAGLAQWPLRASQHAFDEYWFFLLMGWLETGRIGWAEYVLQPMNTHWVPLWKMLYYTQWRLWGVGAASAEAWHVPMVISHALSAWCLGWLSWRYSRSWSVTVLAAGIWATATIGTWDSPLLWPGVGCVTHGVTLLLIAMVCAAHYGLGQRAWHLLTWLAAALSVGMWGAMLPMLLVLPVQYRWLEWPRRNQATLASDGARRFYAEWLTFCLLLGVMLWVCSAGALSERLGQRAETDVLRAIAATPWQLSASLATLAPLPWREGLLARPNLSLTVACTILGMALIPARTRRLVLVFWMLALGYFLLINAARPDLPFEAVARWGRYHYLPVMAWTPAVATALAWLLAQAVQRVPSCARDGVIVGLVAALLGGQTWFQRASAETAAAEQAELFAAERVWRDEWLRELRGVSARAVAEDRDVSLPDLPLAPTALQGQAFPLSVLVKVFVPEGLPRVSVVSATERENVDAMEKSQWLALGQGEEATPRLLAYWRYTQQLEQHLQWLTRHARQRGYVAPVPDVRLGVQENELGPTLATAARVILGSRPDQIEFVTPMSLTVEEWRAARDQLPDENEPAARFWRELLRQQVERAEK